MCQPKVENGRQHSDIKPKLQNGALSKRKSLYVDEAISKTGFGLFNYLLITVGGMTMAVAVFEACGLFYYESQILLVLAEPSWCIQNIKDMVFTLLFILGLAFILPVSECDLNLTTSQKGILGGIPYIGIICSSHLWGFLADTQGRRLIIQPSLFMAFATSFVASFSSNFYFFASMKFLNGFFLSGSASTIYAYLSEFFCKSHRGRAIMGSSIVYGVLCILMPLVAWIVINQEWQFDVPFIGITYKPWRLYLVVCSLPGLFVALILIVLPESPKFVLGQGKSTEAYEILQRVYHINNGKTSSLEQFEIREETESIENRQRILKNAQSRFPLLASIWCQTVPLFTPPHLLSTILICSIQIPIFMTGTGFFMFFAVILNKMATNVDDTVNQRIMMCDIINMHSIPVDGLTDERCTTKLENETLGQSIILEVMFACGFALTGLLINKIGKFPILFFILVGTGFCAISCMLTNIPILQICFFIVLMTCSICANIVNAATVEIYPTALRAMAVSISMMFGRLGSAFGTNIIAFLLDRNCQVAFYVSGISLIVAGVMTFFIPNIHQKVSKQDKDENIPRPSILSTA